VTDRARAYRQVLADALAAGVPRPVIRDVVNAYAGERHVDPFEVRLALADHSPAARDALLPDEPERHPLAAGLVSEPEQQTAPAA